MKIPKFAYILPFVLSLILIPAAISATTDETRHWSLTDGPTENWNAIYGTISGLTNLNPGDEIAAFDASGNCYGIGTYDGIHYYLSAFQAEPGGALKGDVPIPGDFEILGFSPGDEVIFKVYVKQDGKEYNLTTADGQTYFYTSHGMYPPKKLDLAYRPDDDGDDGDGDDGGDDDDDVPADETKVIAGALPSVRSDKTPGAVEEKTPVVTGRKISGEERIESPTGVGLEEDLLPDYYRRPPARRKEPSRAAPVGEREDAAARAPVPYTEPYAEPETVKKKLLEAPESEIAARKGWPLLFRILLAIILIILLILTVKKLLWPKA